MKRRNFLASLAGLFVVRKLPLVNQKLDGARVANKRLIGLNRVIHHPSTNWIEAGERLNAGDLVHFFEGKAYAIPKNDLIHKVLHNGKHVLGVVMIPNDNISTKALIALQVP